MKRISRRDALSLAALSSVPALPQSIQTAPILKLLDWVGGSMRWQPNSTSPLIADPISIGLT
jgi:hypothetical protein